jgi:EAL domain-containing protein (putative c-di-GMP-specific phosphodiesterase class I)
VSPRLFRKEDFVAQVPAVLAASGAPAGAPLFEVTESLLIDGWVGAQSRLSELVQLGIRFSIDDFDTRIVETILSMAHNLKLRVVAEDVETQAQADWLALRLAQRRALPGDVSAP